MTIKSVDATTLKTWLKNDEVVLIDVREPAEYAESNIAGAKLIPLAFVCKSVLPNFENKKLVMQCRSGKRSMTACERLVAEDGNIEVYNLEGGILGF